MGYNTFRVKLTPDAEEDLTAILDYLVYNKRNSEAAISVMNDFERAVVSLKRSAGSLKLDDDPKLAGLGYRRIHLSQHNYFMLYRIESDTAVVDRIFHDLQDYHNRMS